MDMTDHDFDYHDEPTMLPLDDPEADEAPLRLERDLPLDIVPGKALAAMFDPAEAAVRFDMGNGVTFFSYFAHAERLVIIGEGADAVYEYTSWTGRRETERYAHSSRDLQPPSTVE
jgi:hypothetical protein